MFLTSGSTVDATESARRARFEAAASKDPKNYGRKVVATALFGYAFAPFFVIVLLGLAGLGIVHIANGGGGAWGIGKLSVLALGLALMVARSMIVKFPPPEGKRITQRDAPALYAAIEEIQAKLRGPKIDEVWVDDRLNAAIEQAPRFGLFGGHINRLIIGLPLMQALSEKECIAVLAHEYGHLAGAHGKTSAWIYRTRMMWAQLGDRLAEEGNLLSWPLVQFFKRFQPYFDRLSFPLARANEFEADRASADVVGPQFAADALMRLALADRYLSDVFWPDANRRARLKPAPDFTPLASYEKSFANMSGWTQTGAWSHAALGRLTDFTDTHPSISDRIKALGAMPRTPPPFSDRATLLLGGVYDIAREEFDAAWRASVSDGWTASYEEAAAERAMLEALDLAALKGPQSEQDAFKRALLTETHKGVDAALPLYEEARAAYPASARLCFAIGRIRVENGDVTGLADVERAAQLDLDFEVPAASSALAFHLAHSDEAAASAARRHLEATQSRHDASKAELYEFSKTSPVVAHGLISEKLESTLAALRRMERVKAAWLVKRRGSVIESAAAWHLVILPAHERTFDYQGAAQSLRGIVFDGDMYFWFAVERARWMAKKCKKVDGAALSW